MNILGISAYYHDSAAAILKNGELIAAVQEERFTRKKHDASFPQHAILFCLQQAGISLLELDAIVFYDKPLLKFERLLETYLANAPKGFTSFLKAIPLWLKQKLFFKRELYKELDKIGQYNKHTLKILFTEHHVAHAASTFFASPFKEAVILTVDGVGEWATSTISKGDGSTLSVLKETHFPHSLGLFYSAITYYCGFKVNSGEYKLMGLAPYGDRDSEEVKALLKILKDEIITLYEDGSLFLNQQYFNYATGLKMTNDKLWEAAIQFKRREPEEKMSADYINLALAAQIITEEAVIALAKEGVRITGCQNICLAGGVALNCVANGKLVNTGIAQQVYIQPASGDCGGALGAAWAAHYIYFKNERKRNASEDAMQGAYLGTHYSNKEVESVLKDFEVHAEYVSDFTEIAKRTAGFLNEGKSIGWFQGKMEFGPRALGNRSILADARNPEIQKNLNLNIKFRESFRPFAPSVLEEYARNYFDLKSTSPYMLQTQQILKEHCNLLSPNYNSMGLEEKLNTPKSSLPAITHVDFSARIQTVSKSTNPKYHALISAFYEMTQCPVLVNTSFNLRGEPIVCSPTDALKCFMNTNIDYLVIENYIITKNNTNLIEFNRRQHELD
ncbi:MAG: carbamoyltransferase [Bacteroidota bacterium]